MQRLPPLDAQTLLKFTRIGSATLSPDGHQAVCVVSRIQVEQNRSDSSLWLMSDVAAPASRDGSSPLRPLTTTGLKDTAPAFSPDGRLLAFTAEREQDGSKDASPQIYLLPMDGGEARRITRFGPGIGAFRWMPDGHHLVFIAWVWPELRGTAAQNRRCAQWKARGESGLVTEAAQYRHFNVNLPSGRVAHLHRLDIRSGRITDLMEGTPYELPRDEPGLAHFDVCPEGRRIVFCHDPQPIKAAGQRCELLTLDLQTRRFETVADHPRWDFSAPKFGPRPADGRGDGGPQAPQARQAPQALIAAIATPIGRRDTPFAHASIGRLAIWPAHRPFRPADARAAWPHEPESSLDPQPHLHWESDGQALWFTAEERGRCHAWRLDLQSRKVERRIEGGWVHGLAVAGAGSTATVLTVRDSALHPPRLYRLHPQRHGGMESRLDSFNDEALAGLAFGPVEEHQVQGARGEPVQLWVVYPPHFNPRRRHAAVHVIHGGPYAASGDTFSWRWNPHVLAAQGGVVVQTNYHGSSGFGEAFRTSILGRQGELELQDLKAAHQWILRQPWADASRIQAAGASYGGFLVAWMNAHWQPWPQGPLRATVCHAGVFDRRATWSADSYTQRHRDLGATYWRDPERVAAQSPITHAARMNTPTFVIHGAQDFRVPDHNGLAYYNTLKARGIEARLLWFPDEGHWISKPRNALQWYAEVGQWLARHAGKPTRERG